MLVGIVLPDIKSWVDCLLDIRPNFHQLLGTRARPQTQSAKQTNLLVKQLRVLYSPLLVEVSVDLAGARKLYNCYS